MPDFFGVYDDMTVIEYLEFFAAAYKINGPARRKRCDEMLEIVDLDFKRDAYANTLSRGQTQRLGLARVMLHDPQVLLLDEPLSGLDPRARIEMRAMLRKLGALGKTIVVSSHILPELADVCNKVGIIDRGQMQECATVEEVLRKVRPQMILLIEPVDPQMIQPFSKHLEQHTLVDRLEILPNKIRVTLKENVADYSSIAVSLIEAKLFFKHFGEEEINLESAFMALTRGVGAKI
jgi:ABC-2 type transport system ATP-binding protein